MIKLTIGSNFKRSSVIIPETTTIRAALEEHEIDYSLGGINLDGCTLGAGDFDKTFAEFNVHDKCMLTQVAKTQNA